MKRLAAALVVVLALGGCSAVFGPSEHQVALADQLGRELRTFPGVDDAWADYTAGLDQGDDLRAHVTVSSSVDASALTALANDVRDAVDESGFVGSNRQVAFVFADGSTMDWYASHKERLDIDDLLQFFVTWWADPQVATLEVANTLDVTLDATVPSTDVGVIYEQLVDDYGDGPVSVSLPGGWGLHSEKYRFTDARLAMAAEVVVLPGLTDCGFSGVSFTGEKYHFDVGCKLADGVVSADVAPLVNAVLDSHGMLDDTKVTVYSKAEGSVVSNDVGEVLAPS